MQKHYQEYFFEAKVLKKVYKEDLQGLRLVEEICHFLGDEVYGQEVYPLVGDILRQDLSGSSDLM